MNQIESSTVPLYRAVVFAILWNLLTLPGVYLFGRGMVDGGMKRVYELLTDWPFYIWMIFPVIAVVSAVRAIRLSASALRYGRSYLTLRTPAPSVGGTLHAVIRVPRFRMNERKQIRVTLRCEEVELRRNWPDRGSTNRRVNLTTRWKHQTVVPSSGVSRSAGEALIPVKFEIPATCQATGPVPITVGGRSCRARWWMDARAEPRALWSASFEVPVAPESEPHQSEETRVTAP